MSKNNLALLQVILREARATDQMDQVTDKLHGLARVVGVPEEKILAALDSGEDLVIYAP